MLGGGTFTTQNKELPGAYFNFVNTNQVTTTELGARGAVAISYPLTTSNAGKVVKVTKDDFIADAKTKLGATADYTSDNMKVFREIFRHADTIYVFNEKGLTSNVATTALDALEPYDFQIIAAYTKTAADIKTYCDKVKAWRDDYGKKCQAVVYNTAGCDYEGVVNVVNTVTDAGADAHALVAWVAGALAGAQCYESCTNMLYDGEYAVDVSLTQAKLKECLTKGDFALHLVYGDVRVLEDMNTLTTTTNDKGEDFRYNQTIRVIDQIATDIAKLFNTEYLGKVPNDESGRTSFAGRVVAHHQSLETLRAIEGFEPDSVQVEQGDSKRSIVVTDSIKPVNAISQLYMTVYVE